MSQDKPHPLEPPQQEQASEQAHYDNLKEAYKQALEEWETSGDAELWDSVSADGLTPERW